MRTRAGAWGVRTLAVFFSIGLLLVGARIRRIANILAGLAAKQLCSCVFVDGGDEDRCRADLPPMTDRVRTQVDRAARSARATVRRLAERTARSRDGAGCTLE